MSLLLCLPRIRQTPAAYKLFHRIFTSSSEHALHKQSDPTTYLVLLHKTREKLPREIQYYLSHMPTYYILGSYSWLCLGSLPHSVFVEFGGRVDVPTRLDFPQKAEVPSSGEIGMRGIESWLERKLPLFHGCGGAGGELCECEQWHSTVLQSDLEAFPRWGNMGKWGLQRYTWARQD